MPLFELRTTPVEAVQWTGENMDEIHKFTGGDAKYLGTDRKLWVNTKYCLEPVLVGDYIVKLDTSRPSLVLNTTHYFAIYPEQRFNDLYKPVETK